ncbi:MAG: dihydropteroate synthase [Phycisphaerales bacterium JB063]
MPEPIAILPRHASDAPLLMGILNVTPDSFSDGGCYVDVDAAVAHGLAMARDGAGVIDVGGESTRPGAQRIDAEEQCRRVVDVIAALRRSLDAQGFPNVAISIDTTRSAVAAAALDAGASIVNDVSAGVEDDAMLPLVAGRGVSVVLMHMRGEPGTMQASPSYDDVVAEVLGYLEERAACAQRLGIARERIAIDPGIGFGKTLEHNLALLAGLDRFVATGYAVLLGASRKRFIAHLASGEEEGAVPRDGRDRLGGTAATSVLGYAAGVRAFRVHEVWANRQALAVALSVARAREKY